MHHLTPMITLLGTPLFICIYAYLYFPEAWHTAGSYFHRPFANQGLEVAVRCAAEFGKPSGPD